MLLERFGYRGEVHLVSRTRSEIGGRDCVPSIDELPAGVDAAILAIPRAGVADAVDAAGRRGIGGVVVFSSGYAEIDDAGVAEQATLAAVAARHGVALVGPNCLGLVNFADGVPLTFGDVSPNRRSDRPGIAVVAQSGAMSLALTYAAMAQDTTVRFAVSTGNEAVLGIEDFVRVVLEDDATRAVVLLVEQIRQPAEFLALARTARERDTVLCVLHTGRGDRAKAASLTHTGAIAGDQEVLRAVLGREGVLFVDSLDEIVDTAGVIARCRLPHVDGVAFMTDSGAAKTFAIDICESERIELPELGEATLATLATELPSFATASNPVDITAMGLNDPSLYPRVASVLLDAGEVGTLIVSAMPGSDAQGDEQVDALLPVLGAADKPVIYTIMGGESPIPDARRLRVLDASVPLFRSPERALRAARDIADVSRAVRMARSRARPRQVASIEVAADATLGEREAKSLLADAGIAVPAGVLTTNPKDAVAAALALGCPVVLKIVSPDVAHKSDVGGVVSVAHAGDVAERYALLRSTVAAARPDARVDGVLVEKALSGGVEVLLGARRDPSWGPHVVVGMGGVWTEIIDDAIVLPADADRTEIAAGIRRLRGAAVLRGARGVTPRDLSALVEAVETVGAILRCSPAIGEIEINPLLVLAKGEGVVALDALVTPASRVSGHLT